MGLISFSARGNFPKTTSKLNRMLTLDPFTVMEKYGQMGVDALSNATPRKTGVTADAWAYKLERSGDIYKLTWTNGHVVEGRPIAILLQYGHGTGTGGYVEGRDYINPAIRPIMDQIKNDMWEELTL